MMAYNDKKGPDFRGLFSCGFELVRPEMLERNDLQFLRSNLWKKLWISG
jgi:hypothetical protein